MAKNAIVNFTSLLSKNLKLVSFEDWNSLTRKQIQSQDGGTKILRKCSMYEIKCIGFPEGSSNFMPKKKSGYWEDKENIYKFIEKLKENLNLRTYNDWDSLSHKQILSMGGGRLLNKYSLYTIKCMGFPEGKLNFIPAKSKGFWENIENVQSFIQQIREKLNLKTIDDWNNITQQQIIDLGGKRLVDTRSMLEVKCLGCPEGKFKFIHESTIKHDKYWDNSENLENFLRKLKEKLNLKTPYDWNLITQKDIIQFGGISLLSKYSMHEIKSIGCPEGKLTFNKPKIKSGYWNNKENVQNFISKLQNTFHLNTIDDWNSISQNQIISIGGKGLLNKFSLFEVKCLGYPYGILQFKVGSKNSNIPSEYWENEENVQQFLKKLQTKLNLKTPTDWSRLSRSQIQSHGGSGLLAKGYNFQQGGSNIRSQDKRSSQRWLFLQIQKIFPDEEIVEDFYHAEISRQTGFSIQFDVFMVSRNIAVEYHGKQHYEDIASVFAPLDSYKQRDLAKEKHCKQHGIQLIIIPYWWDNKIDSLKETLHKQINITI